MIAVPLMQNTPQWHQFRLNHFGASEAAAMLGVCPYKTREQLLTEKKTGQSKPVDPYTQRRFDEGHRCERLARPLAEKALKDELFSCVGTLENSRLSASFDGLTLDNAIVWEHKILNKTLRETFHSDTALPLHYRVQLEQQLLISGAEKALFMATLWDESGQLIEQYQREYLPDLALRQRIISGWKQFERDLDDYLPIEKTAKPVINATLPDLPLVQFHASGNLSFSGNLDQFKQHANTLLDSVNRNLVSEDDFARAEIIIKHCKTGEEKLSNAQRQLIEAAPELKALFNTITPLQTRLRDLRLDLDKQVKTEKSRIKNELIAAALQQVNAHYHAAQVEYIDHAALTQRMEVAIKGLKNRDKLQNALNRVVLEEKTQFNQRLERGELTRLISLDEMNTALAPLSINDEGLKQMGFSLSYKPIRAIEFPKLIQQLIAHLSAATLPELVADVA